MQRPRSAASLWSQASHPLISVGNASDWIDEPHPEGIAELLIELDDIQESADDKDNTDVEYLRDSADERKFKAIHYTFRCLILVFRRKPRKFRESTISYPINIHILDLHQKLV